MSTVRCPKCDALVAGGSRFCTECGSALEGPAPGSATDIFTPPSCPDCGRALASGAVACPDCGWGRGGAASVTETPAATPPSSPEATGPSPTGPDEEAHGPATPTAPPTPAPPPMDGGTQIFVSHAVLDRGRVEHLLPDGNVRAVDFDADLVIGRGGEGLTLPDDPFVDDRHARVRRVGREFVVEDLGSVNGTFVRLSGDHELQPGDRILIGSQIFEFVV